MYLCVSLFVSSILQLIFDHVHFWAIPACSGSRMESVHKYRVTVEPSLMISPCEFAFDSNDDGVCILIAEYVCIHQFLFVVFGASFQTCLIAS